MNEILKIDNLCAGYGSQLVLRDVSLSVKPGEILGIVGESGCGKSTLLKAVMQQSEAGVKLHSGSIFFDGQNIDKLNSRRMRQLHGPEMGMIFQNPGMSFNALRPYRKQFAETLKSHGLYQGKKTDEQIVEIFRRLQLPDAEAILNSCPYEMSGGMNQRVAIAMAMVLKPKLLLADEPTSALDVTVQLQVVEELLKLRENCGTAIVLVTHNLGVVRKMADSIAILYAGRVVEYGSCDEVLQNPQHPYTRALLLAIPTLGGDMPKGVDGNPPINGASMNCCSFAPRCEACTGVCKEKSGTALKQLSELHWASCSAQVYKPEVTV